MEFFAGFTSGMIVTFAIGQYLGKRFLKRLRKQMAKAPASTDLELATADDIVREFSKRESGVFLVTFTEQQSPVVRSNIYPSKIVPFLRQMTEAMMDDGFEGGESDG